MRTALLSTVVSAFIVLAVVADDMPPPPEPVHLDCSESSEPRAATVGMTVRIGSYATREQAEDAMANEQVRAQLRALLAKRVLPYVTCAFCPPGSTTLKCSGKYTGHVPQQGVVPLEYSVIENPDRTFSVELKVIGAISYSLQCGVCTPAVQ